MKRPIKFRARNEYGEVFYGSFDEDTCTIDCWDIAETVVVERDSVAQLVGYDADGNEVYEGDELVNRNFQVDFFTAVLFGGVITDEGFSHDIPVEMLTLKE